MTTFVIVFNCLCLAWCLCLGVFVLIKRHKNKKEALKRLEDETNETINKVEK